MSWANRFTGLPFVADGRGREGCDCWGLYRIVLSEMRGIELPAFDTVPAADPRAVFRTMEREKRQWTKVSEPCDFDLVLMRGPFRDGAGQLRGGEIHVGCYVEEGQVLHTEAGIDSAVASMARESISHRFLGFYRLP